MRAACAPGFTADALHMSAGVVVVAVIGEIDFAGAAEFVRRIGFVEGSTPSHIVLDLSELVFIDAGGIRALLASARAIEARGGSVILAAPRSHIERVFRIVRLVETIVIERTLAAALARVRDSLGRTDG